MSSALTIGEIASVVAITAGVNSLTGGSITNALGMGPDTKGYDNAAAVANKADPFAGYRGNLASMYSGMLTGSTPTDPTKMPGYDSFKTGVMDPALEASKRSASASGMLYSGNEQLALQSTAQKGYYGFMTDYMNRLAQGSGATNNPATAVGMGANIAGQQQAASMQGLGAIATGLSGFSSASDAANAAQPYGTSAYGYQWAQDVSTTMPSNYIPVNYDATGGTVGNAGWGEGT